MWYALAVLALLTPHAPLAEIRMWYAAPLIVCVSLVYSATRHEDTREITAHALRFGGWVVVFMAVVVVILQLFAWMQ